MAIADIPLAVETFGETQSPNGVSPQFVSPIRYNSIHNLLTKEEKMNPFTALIDWIDENADFGAPIGAFVGVALAIVACFIWG